MIGIDPPKRTHTAVAIDERGAKLGELRIDASWQQVTSMLAWAEQFPDRRWAIEGAGGLGRPLAVGLVAAHEQVVDVPALLSARIRTLSGTQTRGTRTTPARWRWQVGTIPSCAG